MEKGQENLTHLFSLLLLFSHLTEHFGIDQEDEEQEWKYYFFLQSSLLLCHYFSTPEYDHNYIKSTEIELFLKRKSGRVIKAGNFSIIFSANSFEILSDNF